MNTTAQLTDAALAAATAAARLLPSTTPLVAVPARPGEGPGSDDLAVTASFVGARSADLVLVAERAVQGALTAGGENGALLPLSDALRPALEAASQTLGAGVLDATRTEAASSAVAADAHVFALEHEGVPQAWFALRLRAEPAATTGFPGVPTQRQSLHVLYDVEMTLTVELGRTKLPVRQVLELTPGAVLELDRAAGAAADVMVNGRLIARGEVVVVDEDYGIRITEIVAGEQGGS
jgi:flagellar motor switch protein FliN/FliY